jgi:hypothetical protein
VERELQYAKFGSRINELNTLGKGCVSRAFLGRHDGVDVEQRYAIACEWRLYCSIGYLDVCYFSFVNRV